VWGLARALGSLALHECLPAELFEAFTRTCGRPSDGIRFVTEKMGVLLALDGRNAPARFKGEGLAQHRSVKRPRGVTHVFFSAYIELPTWAEMVAPNQTMLVNLMDPIETASPDLAHVNLMHGTKWYATVLRLPGRRQ
jgi:hypothetical protein